MYIHMGPPGLLWVGPFWASLGPCGPGPHGFPWALMGQALMGLPAPSLDAHEPGPYGPLGPNRPSPDRPLNFRWGRFLRGCN